MKVLVKETGETVGINIYGVDNTLRTREFFEAYFSDAEGVHITTEDEREKYGTEAEWTIVRESDFEFLCELIGSIQECMDGIRERYIRSGTEAENYRYRNKNFAI